LNAIREVCSRSSNGMSEELLQDLVQYKTTKNKTVMMAARSLMQLFRDVDPTLLRKKDRGKPKEEDPTAGVDLTARKFGESKAVSFVPGADLLDEGVKGEGGGDEEEGMEEDGDDGWESDDSDDSDDDGWINIAHSDDEDGDENGENEKEALNPEDLRAKAEAISSSRIFTDEDYKKINSKTIIQKLDPKARGRKRRSRTMSESENGERGELVKLSQIENVCKKMRHDKESRLATVMAGREDRPTFSKPPKKKMDVNASTTNKEKLKNKPFMMMSHSRKNRAKGKRSFRDKQIAMRDSLLKQEKNSRK